MHALIKPTIVAGLGLALVGCASVQRAASYSSDGQMTFDGRLSVDGRTMSMSIHPRDDTLLVQRSLGDSTAAGAVSGLTFGLMGGWKPDPRKIDVALAGFLQPVNCSASPVQEIGNDDSSFEAVFRCPAGVDLHALMAQQRASLRRGEPLRP